MKTKSMKILCLILSIMMILGSLPLTALAGTPINPGGTKPELTARIKVTDPVAGAEPSKATVTFSNRVQYVPNTTTWTYSGTEMASGQTFEAGKTYKVKITIKLQDIADRNITHFSFDGEKIPLMSLISNPKQKSVSFEKNYTVPTLKTIDKNLKINNITPGAGLTPSLTSVATEGCKVNGFDWQNITNQDNSYQMEKTEKFVYGNRYWVQFFVEALPGYKFPEGGPDLTIGNLKFNKAPSGSKYVYSASMECEYYGVDVVEINTPEVRHGNKAVYCDPAAAASAPYEVIQTQWDCEVFEYGSAATNKFLIYTKNDDTYFSDTVKVKFNGTTLNTGNYTVNGGVIEGHASVKPEKGLVSSLEFTCPSVVAGKVPPTDIRPTGASKDICPVVSVTWWINKGGWRTLNDGETLTADGEYKLFVKADINSKYIVTADAPVIKNENLAVDGFSSVKIDTYHENDISFWCTPDKIYNTDELINYVDFDFTKYVLADMRGDDTDDTFGFNAKANADFTLSDITWDSENTQDFRDNFAEGKKYTANITLAAKPGKIFKSLPQVRVNGKVTSKREISDDPSKLLVTIENIPCKKTVSEIIIYFTYPENGGEPNPDFTCNNKDVKLANSWWNPHNALFEAGKEYTLHTLLVPGENIVFKDLNVKFNNNHTIGELDFTGINDGNIEINKNFTCLTRYHEKVNVALNPPEKDCVPSDYAETNAGEIKEIIWTPADEIFMPGKTYTCKITVNAVKGEEFRDYVRLYLNGEEIKNFTKSKTEITFEKSYTLPDQAEIDVIAFSGIVFPEEGKNPVLKCSANGRNYMGTWKDMTTGKVLSATDVFIGGHSYNFSVDVNAGEKVFASAVAILSDGADHTMNTEVDLSPDRVNCTVTFVEYPCFKEVKEVTVTGIKAPVDGAAAAVDCTVSAGTLNKANSSWKLKGTDKKVTKFEGGNTYTLCIYLDKTSAIEFAAGCTAKINGKAAKAETINEGRAIKITMDFECKKPEPPKPSKITSSALKIEGGLLQGIIAPANKAADILKNINEKADCKLFDKDGKEITGDALVGTGAEIRLYKDGKVADKLIIVVNGDIDGDGKVTAADARSALRNSVQLDKLNAPQTAAANTDTDKKITAADARFILRVSVGLDSFK